MHRLIRRSFALIVFVGILYVFCYFLVDKKLAIAMHGLVRDTVFEEVFKYISDIGSAVIWAPLSLLGFVVFGIWQLKHKTAVARAGLFISVCMIVSIAISLILKVLLARYRPDVFFSDGLYGFHFLSLQYNITSTPSGHAARMFTLALAVSIVWRRFMPLLFIIAIFVALSRIVVNAHYLSDVLLGAMIGILVPIWVRALLFGEKPHELEQD